MSYLREKRAEQGLDHAIQIIETLVSAAPLTKQEALERMVNNLNDIRKSMAKLDKTRTVSTDKFWRLSKRAIRLSVRIMNLLSKA
mgnify:CR=1 FL=1